MHIQPAMRASSVYANAIWCLDAFLQVVAYVPLMCPHVVAFLQVVALATQLVDGTTWVKDSQAAMQGHHGGGTMGAPQGLLWGHHG